MMVVEEGKECVLVCQPCVATWLDGVRRYDECSLDYSVVIKNRIIDHLY